jgi:hypothetical protein
MSFRAGHSWDTLYVVEENFNRIFENACSHSTRTIQWIAISGNTGEIKD